MISARLVHLIESHAEHIIDRTVAQIHRESETTHNRFMLERELRELARDLLQNLSHWLSGANENEFALRYRRLGQLCFEHGIPLHEAIFELAALRRKMLDFAQEQLLSNSSVELYAEEELDRRVARFFDCLTIELVRGFERALPSAAATH